jgi:hypothetical protein
MTQWLTGGSGWLQHTIAPVLAEMCNPHSINPGLCLDLGEAQTMAALLNSPSSTPSSPCLFHPASFSLQGKGVELEHWFCLIT